MRFHPLMLFVKFWEAPTHAIDVIENCENPYNRRLHPSIQPELPPKRTAGKGRSKCARLIEAIKRRDLPQVRRLAPTAANGQFRGQTPLVAAVRERDVEIARALLPHCDPRKANKFGHTALMFAALQDTPCMVDLLIPVSNVDAASKRGETALMFAAEFGYMPCIEALAAVADHSATNFVGSNALMKAISPDTMAAHSHWALSNIVDLLWTRYDLDAQDDDGWTALMMCTQVVAWDVFDLLARNSNLNVRNNDGNTALDLIYERDRERGERVEAGGSARYEVHFNHEQGTGLCA